MVTLALLLLLLVSIHAYQRIPSKTTTSSASSANRTPSLSTTTSNSDKRYSHSTLYHIKPYRAYSQVSSERSSISKRIMLYQRVLHSYRTNNSPSLYPGSSSSFFFAPLFDSRSSPEDGPRRGQAIDAPVVSLSIPLGAGYESLSYKLKPLFKKSKFLIVTYPIPLNLNLERAPKGFPAPVVTKDNAAKDDAKELEGDVLRATTSWSQSFLNSSGWASDIANIAGNLRWKRAVFDATGAPWEEVVKALQSNGERSDEVTMVFERMIESEEEEESE